MPDGLRPRDRAGAGQGAARALPVGGRPRPRRAGRRRRAARSRRPSGWWRGARRRRRASAGTGATATAPARRRRRCCARPGSDAPDRRAGRGGRRALEPRPDAARAGRRGCRGRARRPPVAGRRGAAATAGRAAAAPARGRRGRIARPARPCRSATGRAGAGGGRCSWAPAWPRRAPRRRCCSRATASTPPRAPARPWPAARSPAWRGPSPPPTAREDAAGLQRILSRDAERVLPGARQRGRPAVMAAYRGAVLGQRHARLRAERAGRRGRRRRPRHRPLPRDLRAASPTSRARSSFGVRRERGTAADRARGGHARRLTARATARRCRATSRRRCHPATCRAGRSRRGVADAGSPSRPGGLP